MMHENFMTFKFQYPVSKFLLECSCTHSSVHCLWLLEQTAHLGVAIGTVSHKAENFSYLAS